jgi:HK97 family phage prohead protease
MTMLRKLIRAEFNQLGDDEVEVVMSTAALARDGHILVPQGCRLENYRANPIILWSHDPDKPLGNSENIEVGQDQIRARVRFAPLGISRKADEIRGLTKAGVIRAVSVGFDPIEGEPLDPKRPRGGQRFTDWELLELSFVSVPADAGALVTARSHGDDAMAEWKVGAARNLAVEDSDAWDGEAAEASVFEWAGGDDFDPAKARKAFLVYDADAPSERGSYKLPIAHAVDGELKVPKGAIRAAASRLPQTDVPDDVKKRAQGVIDHYEKEAGMDDGERTAKPKARAKVTPRAPKIVFTRGLYDVASLCYLFEQLGWQIDCAKWEAVIEGDGSKVPAMLAAVLADLGDALLAMTAEEIAEALAGRDVEPAEADDEDTILEIEERAHIAAAANPAVRMFRRGLAHAKLRAGKALSADTVQCLRDAQACHEEALDMHRSAIRKHKDGMAAIGDLMDRAGVSDPDDDTTQTVQTSSGTDVSGGSDNGRAGVDYRRRQADLLALSASH